MEVWGAGQKCRAPRRNSASGFVRSLPLVLSNLVGTCRLYLALTALLARHPMQLNSYIIGIIRARRAARAANGGKPPAKPDILDRVLTAAEVSVVCCVNDMTTSCVPQSLSADACLVLHLYRRRHGAVGHASCLCSPPALRPFLCRRRAASRGRRPARCSCATR